jgi:hypothetical protein
MYRVNSPPVTAVTSRCRRGTRREEKGCTSRTRDVIATGLVNAAGLVYLLWAAGSSGAGHERYPSYQNRCPRARIAASASAVVPTFGQLLHGNKAYLVVTSLTGLAAAIGGVQMLVAGSGTGVAVVTVAMVVLWLIATIQHSLLAQAALLSPQVDAQQSTRQGPRPASTR